MPQSSRVMVTRAACACHSAARGAIDGAAAGGLSSSKAVAARAIQLVMAPPASQQWWARQDSNPQPSRYERPALPLSYRPAAGMAWPGAGFNLDWRFRRAPPRPRPGPEGRGRSAPPRRPARRRPLRRGCGPASARSRGRAPARPASRRRGCSRDRAGRPPRRPAIAAGRSIARRSIAASPRGASVHRRPDRLALARQPDRPGEQAREHPLGRAGLDQSRRQPFGDLDRDRARRAAPPPVRRFRAAGTARRPRRPGSPRPRSGGVSSRAAVSRSSTAPSRPARLRHDLGRAAAIAGGGRAHILALDHLREADDRVQRRAQLVDQLAQRIGGELGAEHAGRPGEIVGDLVDPRPPRGAAIAEEAAALRGRNRERRKSASRPRPGPSPATLKRASRNGARFSNAPAAWPSTPIMAAARRSTAMLCPTSGPRGAPSTQSRMPSVPVSQRKPSTCSPGTNGRGRRMALALAPEGLDPGDQLADLRIRSARAGIGGAAGSRRPTAPFSSTKSLGPKALQRVLHLGIEILAVAQQRARGGPEPRQQGEPGLAVEPRLGEAAAPRSTALSSAKKASRSGATACPASARAAWRRTAGSTAVARPAQQIEGAVAIGAVPGSAAAGRAGRRAGAIAPSCRSGRSAGKASAVAILSSKRIAKA